MKTLIRILILSGSTAYKLATKAPYGSFKKTWCRRYGKWALDLVRRIEFELVWRHMPIDDERAQEALPF